MSDDDSGESVSQGKSAASDGGKSLLSRIFGALSHRRRRYVLYYLREHEQVRTDDLAIQIAAWERDIPIDTVPARDAERVKTELVHTHLPKLETYALVEYDQRSDAVCYAHPPDLLDEAVELAVRLENPP